MIAAEPGLRDIIKATILGNFPRIDVAMVIDNRHLRGMLMIKLLSRFCFKQEILIHKLFH